ncbi:MAG: hypothetical protein JHC33_01640, partial [Ignisphaera sp.]|nr:hypothetical protein [Ignisphaera sp.]
RAEIRRSIPRGEPDRISDILEEAAEMIEQLRDEKEKLKSSYFRLEKYYDDHVRGNK